MEVLKSLFCISLFFILSVTGKVLFAKDVAGIMYLKNVFAHVHQNPSRFSATLTTLSCGHPVKISQNAAPEDKSKMASKDWIMVNVGPYSGYLQREFLSERKINCFQDKYPKLFDSFNLELSDLYYWGKLQDMYHSGKSKIK
jgi:hypothetical protein